MKKPFTLEHWNTFGVVAGGVGALLAAALGSAALIEKCTSDRPSPATAVTAEQRPLRIEPTSILKTPTAFASADQVAYTLLSASVEPVSASAGRLTVRMRAQNNGPYSATFAGSELFALVGDERVATDKQFNYRVLPGEFREVVLTFMVPRDASRASIVHRSSAGGRDEPIFSFAIPPPPQRP